jgi:hypothetical protein
MKKVYNEKFYENYEEDIKLKSSLLPVIYKRKTYLELKNTHDEVVEDLNDLISELQNIKDYEQYFESEELEFKDIVFAIIIGLAGSFITTSEKLQEFFRLFHDKPKTDENPNILQKKAHEILKHSGQDMDQQGKFANRDGGKVPFGFHRLFFGHDILSWKGDNPFQLLVKQFGFLEGIKKAFLHLIADSCSKQGLPVPGHSVFDVKSGDDITNLLYGISKHVNSEKVQAAFQNMFTIHASDVLGGGATKLLADAYLKICNYQNKKSISIFKMIVHISNFIITCIIGLIKYRIPKINFIALYNFIIPLASFIGIKFKEGKIKRIQKEYIEEKDFMLILKSKIYSIFKGNYLLYFFMLLLMVLVIISFNFGNFKKQNNPELQKSEVYIEEIVEEQQLNISTGNSKIHFVKDTRFFLSEGNKYTGLLPEMTEGDYYIKIKTIANELKELLYNNKQTIFIVHGYTADSIYSTVDDLLLSEQRAERVVSLLIEQGIPKENLKCTFSGVTNLWGNNTSEEERNGNRVVTIEIE